MSNWLKVAGVYKVEDLVSKKVYVGSSDHCDRRLRRNRHLLVSGVHSNHMLQSDWNLHGAENFVFAMLEVTSPENRLEREQFWIDRLTLGGTEVFNARHVGGTREGIPQPAHVGEIVRARMTGVPKTAEHRAKISASRRGQSKSPEHRIKLSQIAQAKWEDPEYVARMRQSHYRDGRKWSPPSKDSPRWYRVQSYRRRLKSLLSSGKITPELHESLSALVANYA